MNFLIIICLILSILCLFFIRKHSKRSNVVAPEKPQEEISPSVAASNNEHNKNNDETEIPDIPSHNEDEDVEEPEVEQEDKLVTHNLELIANLHKVLEEDKIFLRPDIRIDDVARMLLTNRTYITRLMRHEYGLSFNEYINVARVQHSQNLLFSTSMTLDEIAEKSGFQSTSSFSRTFKRYIGAPPLTWLHGMK